LVVLLHYLLWTPVLRRVRKRNQNVLIGIEQFVRIMRETTNLTIPSQSASALRCLAELFPNANPLRIAISVRVARGNGQLLEEKTLIEFATSMVVFFESRLPLELTDKLHLENSDGSFGTDAVVVAIRDGVNHWAIAARFVAELRNWIIQG